MGLRSDHTELEPSKGRYGAQSSSNTDIEPEPEPELELVALALAAVMVRANRKLGGGASEMRWNRREVTEARSKPELLTSAGRGQREVLTLNLNLNLDRVQASL